MSSLLKRKHLLAATRGSGLIGPTRIQSTGKISGSSVSSIALTLATPPSVGNSIIISSILYNNNGSTFTCADNRGNTYTQTIKATASSPAYMVVIFACLNVTTTGNPFTITITAPGGPGYFHACAIEVSGQLTVDQTISQTGNSLTPNTGTTLALTGTNVFAIAAYSIQGTQSSSTVQSVTPPWIEEVENLSGVTVPGEIDSRVLTNVAGTTQNCTWTGTLSGTWDAALAVFKSA